MCLDETYLLLVEDHAHAYVYKITAMARSLHSKDWHRHISSVRALFLEVA